MEVKKMFKKLSQFIEKMEMGEEVQVDDLQIRRLIHKDAGLNSQIPLLTLDEACRRRLVTIKEVSNGATVSRIEVKNDSPHKVFVLEGELVRGARQDRAVNTNTVIEPNMSKEVPVSCVEQGRWRGDSPEFTTNDATLPPSIKSDLQNQVTDNSINFGFNDSNQSEIWNKIGIKQASMSVYSITNSILDIFEANNARLSSDDVRNAINPCKDQVGFLAFIRGGFAGGEIFGNAELYSKKCASLIYGYLLDSLDRNVSFPFVDVSTALRDFKPIRLMRIKSEGSGSEFRFYTKCLQGTYRLVDDNFVYCNLFARKSNNHRRFVNW
jgi:hypothetical protein